MKKFSLFVTILLFGILTLTHGQERTSTVILAGYNVNPPVNTSASGSVQITVQGDSLFVEGSFDNLTSSYRGGGIHYGGVNEDGNQIMTLTATVDTSRTSGTFSRSENGFRLTSGLRQALNEEMLYINIYTQTNPRGEIRGQIPPTDS